VLTPAPRLGETLRALRAPRRAFPIALVGAALAVGQLAFARDLVAFALALGLVAAVVVIAPHAWRRLFGAAHVVAPASARGALYVALALVVVAALAWALPSALGRADVFLSAPGSLLLEPALFCVAGWGLGRDIELERDPLALLVRDVLDAERAASWSLARELDMVKLLCDIAHARRAASPVVRIALDEVAARVSLPSLALLPLAGAIARGGGGPEVTIEGRAADGDARARVVVAVGPFARAPADELVEALRARLGAGAEVVVRGDRVSVALAPSVPGTPA